MDADTTASGRAPIRRAQVGGTAVAEVRGVEAFRLVAILCDVDVVQFPVGKAIQSRDR